jgi:hypothetical protein
MEAEGEIDDQPEDVKHGFSLLGGPESRAPLLAEEPPRTKCVLQRPERTRNETPEEVPPMTETIAQAQLDVIARVLELLAKMMQGIADNLPPSPQELSTEDQVGEDLDVTSEIRRVVQCVLADHIASSIKEVRAVAIYKAKP